MPYKEWKYKSLSYIFLKYVLIALAVVLIKTQVDIQRCEAYSESTGIETKHVALYGCYGKIDGKFVLYAGTVQPKKDIHPWHKKETK